MNCIKDHWVFILLSVQVKVKASFISAPVKHCLPLVFQTASAICHPKRFKRIQKMSCLALCFQPPAEMLRFSFPLKLTHCGKSSAVCDLHDRYAYNSSNYFPNVA